MGIFASVGRLWSVETAPNGESSSIYVSLILDQRNKPSVTLQMTESNLGGGLISLDSGDYETVDLNIHPVTF